jgi:molybdate transport system ATP-binding protein
MGLSVRLRKRVDRFLLDVSWEIGNELAVLFGHSGAGKSMTLQLIAGLMKPDEGFISSNGNTLYDSAGRVNLQPQRRSMGYVFQDRILFPHMTVAENIAYGLKSPTKPAAEKKVKEMIRLFHLEGLGHRYPREISGGQKQRVTLARTLIGKPDALLLDEPFSALDNVLRVEMRQLVRDIRHEFDVPIVLVTHDLLEAYTMADKVILYSGGQVAHVGHPSEIFNNSSNPEVDFFLALNFPLLVAHAP